ncbi:MAG: glycosyltransferase family 2 protein [Gemmatimonadota bacterium]|nr:MAG: glycosyltransferase family 2 protein [Gemmatimonadota bacterium]
MKPLPTVSVGLPVYNGERYLEQALASIANQTLENLEIIISDNGSTDNTEEICRTFAAQDRRIRYFRQQQNQGAAFNYNFVFRKSKAQYFKWATHDDVLADDFLRRCVEVLEHNPHFVLCYSKTRLIGESNQTLAMEEDELRLDSADLTTRFFSALSPMKLCHNPIFGVVRRNILAKTRLIGSFLASDRCLIAELILYGPFHEIPEQLFVRRRHSNSVGTRKQHLKFYDPSLSALFVLPEHGVLIKHLASIRRAPLTPAQRASAAVAVLRWGFQKRRRFKIELENAATDVITAWLPRRTVESFRQIKSRKPPNDRSY